jgi:hypothetical protein
MTKQKINGNYPSVYMEKITTLLHILTKITCMKKPEKGLEELSHNDNLMKGREASLAVTRYLCMNQITSP